MTEQQFFDSKAPIGVTTCQICHRPLTDPVSVSRGIGPVCYGGLPPEERMHRDVHGDGFIHEIAFREKIVLRRIDNRVYTNVPKAVVQHSPSGFEWGYAGSGPADLALNICEIACAHHDKYGLLPKVQCYDGRTVSGVAWALHQKFKQDFLTRVPYDGTEISYPLVERWIDAQIDVIEKEEALRG